MHVGINGLTAIALNNDSVQLKQTSNSSNSSRGCWK